MTLLPNVLRSAVRWGSSAVGIACLMITTAAGAGETWETFASGAGVNGPVRALTSIGTDLIVGGQFDRAFGPPPGSGTPVAGTSGIARWSGSTWSALGSGMNNSVLALTTFGIDNHLYAGGYCQVAPAPPGDGYFGEWSGCP